MRVLILGLGPAASAAAIAACAEGAEVLMVGRESHSGLRHGETLPPEAKPVLSQLGIYELVEQHHQPAPGIVSTWENEQAYENDFVFNPYGNGWHLDRALFDKQLLDIAAMRGSKIVNSGRLREVQATSDSKVNWIVKADVNGEVVEFQAEIVMDATGRSGWFARRIGIERIENDKLIGIVGFLDQPIVDDSRTIIEATENGWCYYANLPNNKSVAAFMTDSDLAVAYPGGPTALWHEQLCGSKHGRQIVSPSSVQLRVVSAKSARLQKFNGACWAAIGDAAVACDPLSSQGISNALEGGMRAASALLGHSTQRQEYRDWLESIWSDYVQNHRHFYSRVSRWPESEFWLRRKHTHLVQKKSSVLNHHANDSIPQEVSNSGAMK